MTANIHNQSCLFFLYTNDRIESERYISSLTGSGHAKDDCSELGGRVRALASRRGRLPTTVIIALMACLTDWTDCPLYW